MIADDGTPIYYETFGKPHPARTLIFCDGIGCDGYIWKYLYQVLKEDYRLIHLHYRGHGKTPAPKQKSHITIAHLADDVAAVLDACEVKEAILFGHSMGVQVGLETYRRHPRRVIGLGLLCGSYRDLVRMFKGQSTLEEFLPWIRKIVELAPRASNFLWRKILPSMLAYKLAMKVEVNGRLVHQEDFFPYLEGMARIDVRLFFDMLEAAGKYSAEDMLGSIKVPVLILAGRLDSFTPVSLSQEMHKRILGSDFYIIEEGSHTAPIERSLEVTSKVNEFLLKQF